MLALVIFGLRLLRLAVYIEAAVIVALLMLCAWLLATLLDTADHYEQVRAERNKARATLQALQTMSEIRSSTVIRMNEAARRRWL